jgi:serine/threonine protein kinase
MEDLLTGQVVSRYTIGPLLGKGGMGQVYQALSEGQAPVAIKFLHADSNSNEQARFVREIRIMQSLKHTNIMPVLESGVYNNSLFYTMPLINGTTLGTLKAQQVFSPAAFWPIVQQVSSGLVYGRENNAIHRDLKPDNIYVEQNGEIHVYIGDFGLAKRVGIDATLTSEGTVMGTPTYMAPESVLGELADHRSDIYAMAIITYEALLGLPPFKESQSYLTAMAHVTKQVPKPTVISPEFPPTLESVLMRGLEKDREYRYQLIEEFARDYQTVLNGLSDEARNRVYGTPQPPSLSSTPTETK